MWFTALFFGGYILFLFYVCRKNYIGSGKRLSYGISDIWAFILGLSPSILLLSHMIQGSSFEGISVLILLGFGQLAGMFLALLENVDSKRIGNAGSFVNILAGAIAGVGLAFIYVGSAIMLAFIVALIWILAFFTYGIALLPVLLLACAFFTRRNPVEP